MRPAGQELSVRAEGAAALLLLCVWLAPWLPRLSGPIDLRWDAAVYYTLGTSLAEGKGYRLLNEPGEIQGIQYPPGLPAIVAAHQWLLGTADPVVVGHALRRFYFAISGLYLASVYWLLRSTFGPLAGVLGASICGLSMPFVWLSDRCYSDLPFLLATTCFMLLARGQTRLARFGAGTAATTAFLLRTVGAAFLVAWLADAAAARQWKRASARLLLTVLLVGGWQGYVWTIERSPAYRAPTYTYQRAAYLLYNVSYTTNASLKRPTFPEDGYVEAGDVVNRFFWNVAAVPAAFGEVLSTTSENWYTYLEPLRSVPVIGLAARWRAVRAGLTLLGLLTLAGLWIHWRRDHVLIAAAVVIYVLGVCTMAFNEEFGRYLGGIQPILVLLLFTTLFRARRPRMRYALLAIVLMPLFIAQALTLREVYAEGLAVVTHRDWRGHDVRSRMFSYEETFRSFDAAIEWLGTDARPDDVIASSQPHWVYLKTGRRSVMPPFVRDLTVQQSLLDSVPVDYVIVDSNGFSATREYSLPALNDGDRWERVYTSSGATTEIYKRRVSPESR